MSVTRIFRYVAYEMNIFFRRFHKSLSEKVFCAKQQQIHCIFETFMTSIYKKKIWQKYGLFMQNKYLYIIMSIRIDTILSKYRQNNFQNLLFKKFLAQLGNQRDKFWKLYLPADIFWLSKTVGRVVGYTTGCYMLYHYLFFANPCHIQLSNQYLPYQQHCYSNYINSAPVQLHVDKIFQELFLMLLFLFPTFSMFFH